jgi:hypothetical protein
VPTKTPKRTTDNKARGRKGRGTGSQRVPDPITHHACQYCGKRRMDVWNKVPRLKYGTEGKAAHPYCARLREGSVAA